MNIKLTTLAAALAFSAAMAQEQPAAAPAPAPAPVEQKAEQPVAEAPAAASDSSADFFNVLRAIAFNMVGNQAAATRVNDALNTPYQMGGRKFAYLEPTNTFATVAFGDGLTKFIAFDNSQGTAFTTLGLASKSFGIALGYALNKKITSIENTDANAKVSYDDYTVYAGDRLTFAFAAPIGGLDIAINAAWTTYATETSYTLETKTRNNTTKEEVDPDYWDLSGAFTLSNGPSAKSVSWAAGAAAARHENYTEAKYSDKANPDNNDKSKVTGTSAYTTVQPFFNLGGAILSSGNAHVLLGLNTSVPLTFFDEFKEKPTDDDVDEDDVDLNKDNYFTMAVLTSPNILAELGLGNCWMVFGGASYDWTLFSMQNEEFIRDYTDKENKSTAKGTAITTNTGTVTVSAGTRFQYKNFALEASIANNFYNNPLTGFNGGDMIANLGAFLNF